MSATSTATDPLAPCLEGALRAGIEQHYYARIDARCRIDQALRDPAFVRDPGRHLALFTDHGTVHVRDVANGFLQMLDAVHGRLIPRRDAERLGWIRCCGVLLAYLHDIGMASEAPHAREMHPEYVVKAVLGNELDWLVDAMLASGGGLVARLQAVAGPASGRLLREVLALAMGHSKSKVPVHLLNDPPALAQVLWRASRTPLAELHLQQKAERDRVERPLAEVQPWHPATTLTDSGEAESTGLAAEPGFAWLRSDDPVSAALRADAIDCVRVLRAADALRQRGTVLKTSGSYEIFIDRHSGSAIYALRFSDGRSFLLEMPDSPNAAEANLAGSELDPNGDLRFTFNHGAFRDDETTGRMVEAAARLVSDVQQDVIESFRRPAEEQSALTESLLAVRILIETTDDSPQFAGRILAALGCIDPVAAERCRIVPSLAPAPALERSLYLRGKLLREDPHFAEHVLHQLARMGHAIEGVTPGEAFADMRRVALAAGETLIRAGDPSGFVYIPEAAGLIGQPLGGYAGFRVAAWAPIGVTGVVRGATRNATIVAETPVSVLAIPRTSYLRHWYRTYGADDLPRLLAALVPPD